MLNFKIYHARQNPYNFIKVWSGPQRQLREYQPPTGRMPGPVPLFISSQARLYLRVRFPLHRMSSEVTLFVQLIHISVGCGLIVQSLIGRHDIVDCTLPRDGTASDKSFCLI